MTDETRILFAEIDQAVEAWNRSAERLEALAAEMRQLADTLDAGLADSQAELQEWF
jgi:hypothetical protein